MKSTIIGLSVISFLSACGGSTTGVSPFSTTLATFGDGAGVVRAEQTQDGTTTTMLAMGPNVANYEANPAAADDLVNVVWISDNAYGSFYSADAVVNGIPINTKFYTDIGKNVVVMYAAEAFGSALAVGGEKASNIPTGVYTYRGTNMTGYRDGNDPQIGTFAMGVDFTNGRATLNGSTASTYISSNDITVNVSNGTFYDDNMTFGVTAGGAYSGSIDGLFHGDGATGVTGIYYDNVGVVPTIVGSIAGTR